MLGTVVTAGTSAAHRGNRFVTALLGAALLTSASVGVAAGDPPVVHRLVPIGSDYRADTLALFAREAAAVDTDGTIRILVIPITYSRDAFVSKNGERSQNLKFADNRRSQVASACEAVRGLAQTCEVTLLATLVRADAYLAANLVPFDQPVDGMYVLGGDQTVAMQLVANTPLEGRMAAAFAAGAVFGGNSAGDAIQSRTMINGFAQGFEVPTSLRRGAVDVWGYSGPTDATRGLVFGLAGVIDDQHAFEAGRLGRSINAAVSTGLPVLAMDAGTGGVIVDETILRDLTGFTAGVVIDPVTLGAGASWAGPFEALRSRGIIVHVLPPGSAGYDFGTRRPTLTGAPVVRPAFESLDDPSVSVPVGAGPLILSGGLSGDASGRVGDRLVELGGGAAARIVVLSIGYEKNSLGQGDAKAIADGLQPGVTAPVRWFNLDIHTDQAAVATVVGDATAIVLTGRDAARVGPALVAQGTVIDAVEARWATGASALLADDAAAAAIGPRYVADAPPGADPDTEASEDILAAGATVVDGLGWYGNLRIEPHLLADRAWGQLFHLVHDGHADVAAGVDVGAAIEVLGGVPTIRGDGSVVVVDGRLASIGNGTNGGLRLLWLVVSVLTGGDAILAP